jgi:DNA-binding transcriptional LysR family regulator
MNMDGLKYVLMVAEAGSFAAAARALNLHVSTLSRNIFALENELGVTIFEREHSGVHLTSSGQAVLIYVRQVLADLDALANIGQSGGIGKSGHIHLGIRVPPTGNSIKRLLSRWHHFHPDVGLSLHEMSDWELRTAIGDRQLDAVIIGKHALWPDVAFTHLCRERLLAAIPQSHPLAHNDTVTLKRLRKETILVQDWPHSHVTRSYYGSLLGHGACFSAHSASKQSLFALVATGFGITLAVESQNSIGFPGITFIPITDSDAVIDIVLAWAPQSEDQTVGRFVSFMRDEVKSLRSR